MSIPVFIPTLGRAGRIDSLSWIPKDREIVLAVAQSQYESYAKHHPGMSIWVYDERLNGNIGAIRGAIMSHVNGPHWTVDDDIQLRVVRGDASSAMAEAEAHLSSVPMAGFRPQIFSQGAPEVHRNGFLATVYAIDSSRLGDYSFMSEFRTYEDVALSIHAIQCGGNAVLSVARHTNKSPSYGGCSTYRNESVTAEGLDALIARWPSICTKVPTKNKTHSQSLGWGLRVSWRRIGK